MAGKINPHLDKIYEKIDGHKNFVVNGGAGSGKTYALIQSLQHIFSNNPKARVACITYTNVAVNEIRERVPFEGLFVDTIHNFVWELIRNYKNNLSSAIVELVSAEKETRGTGIRYSGEQDITYDTYHPETIEYKEYLKVEDGVISHDEVLKLGHFLFSKYPLINKILADKYDYIFVDEYQDTSNLIISLLLETFISHNPKTLIGLFGDPMQSIYGTGIGDVRKYIIDGILDEVVIEGNRRCSKKVINLLNKIRTDITQTPENLNLEGNAIFLYSNNSTDIDVVKQHSAFKDWDFNDSENTKELYLTHRLISHRYNFQSFMSVYTNTDRILGDSPDKLISHLLKLQEMIRLYQMKKYYEFIKATDYKIFHHKDKQELYAKIQTLSEMKDSTIKEIVQFAHDSKICLIDDKLKQFAIDHEEIYTQVMSIKYGELVNLYEYINKHSPYSTQHGIKGAEFDDVFVILDNGNWNNYNYEQLLGTVRNPKIYARTHKLFYVSCSRAKRNLVVYCPNFKESMRAKTEEWFGKENMIMIQ
ncbi:MAG: ATP-dependent helicase [Ruminococcaceae bacterium]|nr:ATP-dependent helicase [Oscillospiraceae bacterium]